MTYSNGIVTIPNNAITARHFNLESSKYSLIKQSNYVKKILVPVNSGIFLRLMSIPYSAKFSWHKIFIIRSITTLLL